MHERIHSFASRIFDTLDRFLPETDLDILMDGKKLLKTIEFGDVRARVMQYTKECGCEDFLIELDVCFAKPEWQPFAVIGGEYLEKSLLALVQAMQVVHENRKETGC